MQWDGKFSGSMLRYCAMNGCAAICKREGLYIVEMDENNEKMIAKSTLSYIRKLTDESVPFEESWILYFLHNLTIVNEVEMYIDSIKYAERSFFDFQPQREVSQ